MITYADHCRKEPAVEFIEGDVLGWRLDDYCTGLRTFFALWRDGRAARSMQVDLWGKRASVFDYEGQRWLTIPLIPDNAIFIGWREPPKNVQSGV